jgi:hypothetical protein
MMGASQIHQFHVLFFVSFGLSRFHIELIHNISDITSRQEVTGTCTNHHKISQLPVLPSMW